LLIGNATKRPANAPYTVVLRDDEVIEQTVSQPKIEAYAKPAAAPIAVIIKVNFISKTIKF